jgi:hypothetical protein
MTKKYYIYDDGGDWNDCRWLLCILAAMSLMLVMMLAGCRSNQVVVEKVHTDTTYITKAMRDSIYLHDSIYVHTHARAESVFVEVERFRTRYIERVRVDTILRAVQDSVPVPYPVVVEVQRRLQWWQKAAIYWTAFSIIASIGFLWFRFRK